MDPEDIDLAASGGASLSVAQRAALQVAFPILTHNYHLNETLLLGRILAKTNDYFLAIGLAKDNFLQKKTYFFSTDAVAWAQLPKTTPAMHAAADALPYNLLFTGDVSHVYSVAAADDGGEESAEPTTLTEEERLAVLVEKLDTEVAIAPKGALTMEPNLAVKRVRGWGHIYSSERDYGSLSSYVMINQTRPADVLASPIEQSLDALMPADSIMPKNTLCVLTDAPTGVTTVRNLAWPGAVAFAKPGSGSWGYCYFGAGLKNHDLPFMLP